MVEEPAELAPGVAPVVFNQLKVSRAIRTNKFGLQQFVIGQPYWEKYLKGDEQDPKKAMLAAKNAVYAESKKVGSPARTCVEIRLDGLGDGR